MFGVLWFAVVCDFQLGQPLQKLKKNGSWPVAAATIPTTSRGSASPQYVLAMQEIIWRVRPDVIVETG
jgi:hypothetical protein